VPEKYLAMGVHIKKSCNTADKKKEFKRERQLRFIIRLG